MAVGVLVVAFAGLASVVWQRPDPVGIDRAAAELLGASNGSGWYVAGQVVSWFGSGTVVTVLAVAIGVVAWRRGRGVFGGLTVPLAAAVAGLTEQAAKSVVGRHRPPTAGLSGASGFAFPSGHTAGFTALVVATILVLGVGRRPLESGWRLGASIFAVFAAVAVGGSRIVVGAHYATDVIGGYLLGTAVALAVVSAESGVRTLRHDGLGRRTR